MFRFRLKIFLLLLGVGYGVIIGRLACLQIAHADRYRREAELAKILPLEFIPFVRGDILDRRGRRIVADEPCWDICVHYGVLANDPATIRTWARRWLKYGRLPEGTSVQSAVESVCHEIARMWLDLAEVGGVSSWDLAQQRQAILNRVAAIRRAVLRGKGYEVDVHEQFIMHPIVEGLDDQAQVRARLALQRRDYPWLDVRSSTRRVYHDATALAHVVGRVGPVWREHMSNDPNEGDLLRSYHPGETLGISGVERLCEQALRGARGKIVEDRDGHIVERRGPERGHDVRLTIDLALQKRIYDRLAGAVAETNLGAGASAAVVHIPSRQALALVSYPAYDPNTFGQQYQRLVDDTRRIPLLSRAVGETTAPGSIVKPAILTAALSEGLVRPEDTKQCRGYLFPAYPNRWREWCPHGSRTPMRHGFVNAEEAIKNSCNIYFYQIGEQLGPELACRWLARFGFGRLPGTGLPEERDGILPTKAWIEEREGRRPYPSDGRFLGIGQGYLAITPAHAANLIATLAVGEYVPLVLLTGQAPRPEVLDVKPQHWRTVRNGLFRAVNEPRGTAYRYARLHSAEFALCGKTGSAQTGPRVTEYAVQLRRADGSEAEQAVKANSKAEAADRIRTRCERAGQTIEILSIRARSCWPARSAEQTRPPTHAWFVGYVQPAGAYVSDAATEQAPSPTIAIAVMIEFAGSGGRAAAPVARDIANMMVVDFREYLDPAATAAPALAAGTPTVP